MDPEALATFILNQFATVSAAPIPVLVAVLAAGWLIRRYYAAHFKQLLDTKDATIEQKESLIQEFRQSLEGASPDEARKLIENLENRLAILEPRRISKEVAIGITKDLAPHAGSTLCIHADSSVPDANRMHSILATAVRDAGWLGYNSTSSTMSYERPSRTGLVVCVTSTENPTEAEKAVISAIEGLQFPFELAASADGDMHIYITQPEPEAP